MFTKIGLKNFKCFESVEINPRLITVLIGANGTGKSSIIQTLMLGKQSIRKGALRLNGQWLTLGEFREVVRRGGPSWLEIDYSGKAPGEPPLYADAVLEAAAFDYHARVIDGGVHDTRSQIDAIGQLRGRAFPPAPISLDWEEGLPPRATNISIGNTTVQLSGVAGFASPVQKSGGNSGDPELYRALNRFADQLVAILPRLFEERVFLVPAGRGIDLPQYPLGDTAVAEFSNIIGGSTGQAAALLTTLLLNHAAEEQVSAWFEEALAVRVRARNRPGRQVALEITPARPSLGSDNAVNQGYGYGPLVFILLQLFLAPHGSTVCIEEPEIHLHPRAQADVTGVMARVAKKENKQLILATHSEHVLIKLLNLVGNGELAPEDLAVYYFSKDEDSGIAQAEPLKVNDDGTLEEGLRGFFEQDMAEMDEFLSITKKRA